MLWPGSVSFISPTSGFGNSHVAYFGIALEEQDDSGQASKSLLGQQFIMPEIAEARVCSVSS